MMQKIRVWVSTDRIGSAQSKEIEIDDDLGEVEIADAAKNAAIDMMQWGYEKINEPR